MPRQINKEGIDIIKTFEGFSAVPYQDQAGVWTQGYGTTKGITEDDPPITEQIAESYLRDDISTMEQAVEDHIYADINDNQFSALVSLCYNEGTAPLVGTLGKLINSGQLDAAANEFLKWIWIRIDGTLVESNGLKNRRKAERSLFVKPVS